jgi:hypothetical protein
MANAAVDAHERRLSSPGDFRNRLREPLRGRRRVWISLASVAI